MNQQAYRIHSRRRYLMLATGVSLAMLAGSLWFAMQSRAELGASLQRVSEAQRYQEEASRLRQEYGRWQEWRAEREAFEADLADARLSPEIWRVRELTVDRAKLPRAKVQAYLSSLAGAEGYLFLPERFRIKVLYDTDDLLRWQPGSTDELELTLVGDYFIRGEQ